jgi:putative addiction module killer protein
MSYHLLVYELRDYVDAKGRIPFRDWVASLDAPVRSRIIAATLRMGFGNFSACKSAGSGLSELRVDFGPGYRIYFGKDGEEIVVLLGGGTKRHQQFDIDAARTLWTEYKKRKREETNATHKKF